MKKKPNRIAELRRSFGISQERLAEEINVTQASVSLYENGNNIPLDALISIANYFGVSLEYILRLSDDGGSMSVERVSRKEYNILRCYRSLAPRERRLVDAVVDTIMGNITPD